MPGPGGGVAMRRPNAGCTYPSLAGAAITCGGLPAAGYPNYGQTEGVSQVALGQKRNRPLVLDAARSLNQFKYEVANELGVQVPQSDYWGDLPSRVTGAVGGHMVRRMIAAAEQALIEQAAAGVRAGFQQALNVPNPQTVPNPAQPTGQTQTR